MKTKKEMKTRVYKELTCEELRDTKRILNGDNWLDSHIENDLREIVRCLRNNGVNTVSACQHIMTIDCLSSNVTVTVNTIRQIFANLDIKDYHIKAHWHPENGYACHDALVIISINSLFKNKRRDMKKNRDPEVVGVEAVDVVLNKSKNMPAKPCPNCHKVPKISCTKDDTNKTWYFSCDCGIKGELIFADYKTKEKAIEMYNAMLNTLKQVEGDIIIEIRIAEDNQISVSCKTTDNDGIWVKRIEKARSSIIRALKSFTK